jgi:hypothetical protein
VEKAAAESLSAIRANESPFGDTADGAGADEADSDKLNVELLQAVTGNGWRSQFLSPKFVRILPSQVLSGCNATGET